MLLKLGGYPLFAGTPQGKNLVEHDPAFDDWSRLLLVRYPSRRAFMRLLTHPAFHEIEPYKVMALQLVLTPATPERVVPSVPLMVGGVLLVVFLAIGWARAAGVFCRPGSEKRIECGRQTAKTAQIPLGKQDLPNLSVKIH
jgi:hypothetical protein